MTLFTTNQLQLVYGEGEINPFNSHYHAIEMQRMPLEMCWTEDERRRSLHDETFKRLLREGRLIGESCFELRSNQSRHKSVVIKHGLTSTQDFFSIAFHIQQEEHKIVLQDLEWAELISALGYLRPIEWDLSDSHRFEEKISSCNLELLKDQHGNLCLTQLQENESVVTIIINLDILASLESLNSNLLSNKSCLFDMLNFTRYYRNVIFLTSKLQNEVDFNDKQELQRKIRGICDIIADDQKKFMMDECLYFAFDRVKDDLNPEKSQFIYQYNFLY